MDVIVPFLLFVLLRTSCVTCSCNCESVTGKLLNVQGQLEQLRRLVDVLNVKVTERVKKEHEDKMAALKVGRERLSNAIPVMVDDVKKCLDEFDARVSKGEARLEWLAEEVESLRREKAVLEGDLKRNVSVTLKRTVREVDDKIDVMSTSLKSRLKGVESTVSGRLEEMERQMKVDDSVVQLLEAAGPSPNPTEDVLEIVFVDSADAKGGNFSVNVTEEGQISCPGNGTSNGTEECLQFFENGTLPQPAGVTDFGSKAPAGKKSEWSLGQVLSALTEKVTNVQKNMSVLNSLEQKLTDVQRNVSALNLQDRLVNLEGSSRQTRSVVNRLSELEHEARVSISDFREAIADVELKIWNLTDRVQLAGELQQSERSMLEKLLNESNRAKEVLVGALSEVRAMESAVLGFEDFKNSTSVIVQNLTVLSESLLNDVETLNRTVESTHVDVTAAVQLLNSSVAEDVVILKSSLTENMRSLNEFVERKVESLNRSVEDRSQELKAAVDEQIGRMNVTLEDDVSLLNSSMMDNVQSLNDSVRQNVQLLNRSIAERVELLNNTLSRHVEMLNETLRDELVVLNVSLAGGMQELKTTVLNMASPRDLKGWHPNDSLPCPGLLFLSQGASLVLTTDNGTFRSPHLSEEPLPAGSQVHFRCEHQGLFRLEGEQVIRCASGRWSARPPTCVPLPTLEDLKSNKITDHLPSVLYDASLSPGAVEDKRGVLTLNTGLYFELTCLYPKNRGNVSWLHNDTVIRDPSAAWSSGPDAGYAYVLRINKTDHSHSGTYTCVGPGGKNHTVRLRVEGAECDPLDAPANGSIVANKGSTALGSRVQFSCLLGYRLEGSHELTCLASGRWSSAEPVCVEIEDYVPPRTACTQPRVSGDLDVVPVQRYYADKSRVSFVCKNGRRVIGKATAMCRRGRWTDGEPICD